MLASAGVAVLMLGKAYGSAGHDPNLPWLP
ncbi:hypothetical protein CBM2634_B100117 [Cupriavidus taiwanensis]|uniref:Uncharacterized protein n=1 Tax=Cupriavidus taiwanensis TaxID=164546 RepID=A0A375J3G6_9BURK|nr:hypothetical protein CBM2634_B100117 [Cupriavidus taiwanensis]